jgi:hypothetical protein
VTARLLRSLQQLDSVESVKARKQSAGFDVPREFAESFRLYRRANIIFEVK